MSNTDLMAHNKPRLLITSGEPAGIGPDLVVQLSQLSHNYHLTVIADPDLIEQRAELLSVPIKLNTLSTKSSEAQQDDTATINILPVELKQISIPGKLDEVDGIYELHLDRGAGDLDPISRALLRMGTYELSYRIDVPYKVAINEAVNLAKKFGPTDAYKYINGILDKVAISKRSVEVMAEQRR